MNLQIFRLCLLICTVTLTAGCAKEAPLPEKRATWIWDTALIEESGDRLLDFAAEQTVNLIYLQFDEETEANIYSEFIEKAAQREIEVHALNGKPEWGKLMHFDEIKQWLEYIQSYNDQANATAQFSGIHLDIEPYLLPEWEMNPYAVIEEWQKTAQSILQNAESTAPELEIGVDIPFWLDQYYVEDQSGDYLPLSRWMLRNFDHVTFMAYRNHAEGQGGILDIIDKEITWAETDGASYIVAVETLPMEPEEAHITFHSTSEDQLMKELNAINWKLSERQAYLGYAVHHMGSWKEYFLQ